MKLRYISIMVITLTLTVTACANENDESNNDTQPKSQPLAYETKNERDERLGIREQSLGEKGGYEQSKQKKINRGDAATGNNTDIFTNEQSKQISDHLEKLRKIKMAQVAISDEKVIVAVMLNEHNNHDINSQIEKEVRNFEPNKEIVVYTDDKHWDRMSNLSARMEQAKFPGELKDDIIRLFNPDREQ